MAFARTIRITDAIPLGDVTLFPSALSGRPDAHLAHVMAEELINSGPESDAEALRHLRLSFPDSPLTVRVAALAAMMRR